MSMTDGIRAIAEAIGRGKGRFALGAVSPEQGKQFGTSAPFALAVGSRNAVRLNGGFICTIGMTMEHVRELRDLCNEALGESS